MRADRLASIENLDLLSGAENVDNRVDDEDIQSLAESVRSNSSDLRSIHSKKSMEALVTKSKEKLNKLESIMESEVKCSPVIITHQDDDGARIAETKSLNKLPFKNRNPAL